MAEVLDPTSNLAHARSRFSSLQDGFAFFDAPGGTQVPDEVGGAIAQALREASANLGAGYATSLRVKQILEQAEAGAARFLGCDPHEITFGTNMTSLNFALSRTAGRDFAPGDEILISAPTTTPGWRHGWSWPTTGISSSSIWTCIRTRRWTSTTWRRSCRIAPGSSPSPGRRTPSARSSTPSASAGSPTTPGRWPGSAPSTTPPTSRSTCGRSAPTSCCARRTSSPAPISGWPTAAPR